MAEGIYGEKVMVRWTMANNVATPPAVLEQLTEDEDLWVRRAVAENPATPSEVFEKLAEDPRLRTCRNAAASTRFHAVFRVVAPGPGWWFLIMSAVAVGVTIGATLVWLVVLLFLGGAVAGLSVIGG